MIHPALNDVGTLGADQPGQTDEGSAAGATTGHAEIRDIHPRGSQPIARGAARQETDHPRRRRARPLRQDQGGQHALGAAGLERRDDVEHFSVGVCYTHGVKLKILAKRSVLLTCAYYLFDDWRTRRRWAAGRLDTTSGTRHAQLDLDASLAYIEKVYADYLAYAGCPRFTGRVAEIGPGDNFGVALLLLGNGAEEVHAIDRYRPQRDPVHQAAIYQALADRHGLADRFTGPPGEATLRGLHYHPGRPAETFFHGTSIRFNAILSRAVIEHLYDPAAALTDMFRAVQPGGVMVHRIDLRDHGMFTGHHPLTSLTIPEAVYRRMTRGSGRPNRVLLPAYRNWLKTSGARGSLRITRLAGVEAEVGPADWDNLDPALTRRALECVAAVRPSLAAGFKNLPDEDLAVSGCLLVARRPDAPA